MTVWATAVLVAGMAFLTRFGMALRTERRNLVYAQDRKAKSAGTGDRGEVVLIDSAASWEGNRTKATSEPRPRRRSQAR